MCDTVEEGLEELATGIGCFVTVLEPTYSGIEFDRFFGGERFRSLTPAFQTKQKNKF